MAKKNDPARPTGARRKGSANALVPSAGPPLPGLRPGLETAGTFLRDGDTALVPSCRYPIGPSHVVADVYYVSGRKSADRGPWLDEADKIAWLDEASGYECIILRASRGGHLCGYVGVPPGHPLHGFDHDAIPAELDIEVHGGISYSALCEHGPSPAPRLGLEARRICHITLRPGARPATAYATDYRVAHEDAWWFGFECNQVYDLVPNPPAHLPGFLAAETGGTYRDEAYVYGEVVELAAQLRAIADDLPKPERRGPPPPPIGLGRGGGS